MGRLRPREDNIGGNRAVLWLEWSGEIDCWKLNVCHLHKKVEYNEIVKFC